MTGNTKRSRQGVAAILTSIALMAPIRAQEPTERGPSEGIKVHGHWTVTVRNSDGTIATSREFENALVTGGSMALSWFLSRSATPGIWAVFVNGVPSPCAGIYIYGCVSQEGQPGFVVSRPTDSLVKLEGSTTVDNPNASMIDRVSTQIHGCVNTVTPVQCASLTDHAPAYFSFTQATIVPSIPIRNGQIIQFSVVFSFS
jgi:hypothetical protein